MGVMTGVPVSTGVRGMSHDGERKSQVPQESQNTSELGANPSLVPGIGVAKTGSVNPSSGFGGGLSPTESVLQEGTGGGIGRAGVRIGRGDLENPKVGVAWSRDNRSWVGMSTVSEGAFDRPDSGFARLRLAGGFAPGFSDDAARGDKGQC
jgi:hypothetical protein